MPTPVEPCASAQDASNRRRSSTAMPPQTWYSVSMPAAFMPYSMVRRRSKNIGHCGVRLPYTTCRSDPFRLRSGRCSFPGAHLQTPAIGPCTFGIDFKTELACPIRARDIHLLSAQHAIRALLNSRALMVRIVALARTRREAWSMIYEQRSDRVRWQYADWYRAGQIGRHDRRLVSLGDVVASISGGRTALWGATPVCSNHYFTVQLSVSAPVRLARAEQLARMAQLLLKSRRFRQHRARYWRRGPPWQPQG